IAYLARTVAAHYLAAGRHGERPDPQWLEDEIAKCTERDVTAELVEALREAVRNAVRITDNGRTANADLGAWLTRAQDALAAVAGDGVIDQEATMPEPLEMTLEEAMLAVADDH